LTNIYADETSARMTTAYQPEAQLGGSLITVPVFEFRTQLAQDTLPQR
jgi:hypothetical protein